MDKIQALSEVNLVEWIIIGFAIIFGVTQAIKIIGEFANYIGKPIKWIKLKNSDHDLIIANSNAIKELAELHKKDIKLANDNEKKIQSELASFMDEVKADIKQFTQNRIHDRGQSLEIQKELKDSIKTIVDSQNDRDNQIGALMCGTKELLGNTIDELYEKYINLEGIPQNEVDEFDSIYDAYSGLNGNHGRETKYKYVKEHLPVIPVRTELIKKNK